MAAYTLTEIFVMGCLVYLMESYVIRCPEQAEWSIRAKIRCPNTTKYFCLYNYIAYSYEEGCTEPDWDRPGSKRVYSRNFNRRPCNDTRYQPIKFVTNGNSDCIFRKSLCTEEGQILFTNGTTETDSTCRCDYKQEYEFVTVPRNKCYCRPSEEDCSCYLKKCQGIGYYLSADYECTNDITKKTNCPSMSENPSKDPHIDMAPTGIPREHDSYAIRRKFHVVIVVLVCIFGMIVITMCFMFHQRLLRCLQQSTKKSRTSETERMDTAVEVHTESEGMDTCSPLNTTEENVTNDQSAVEDHTESEGMDTCSPLNTTEENVTNDQSAVEVHTESGRRDAGPSLDTIDQNATNDQSAVEAHIESGRMDAGSLDTIDQNVTDDQSDGIRLEEKVSGNNGDNQIALMESDENQKSALEKLKDIIKKEELVFKRFNEVVDNSKNGPVKLAVTGKSGIASSDGNWKSALDEFKENIDKDGLEKALKHFNEDLDNWKNEPVKLAVTGKSGVGKSSFINAIRNLKPGDPGFAASSSSGNTTKHATVYEYPGNHKITLHDLPGFGTIQLHTNDYEKTMELHKYDYILIVVGNIEEHDIEIAKKLKKMKRPFCFVRSKIDVDILNAKNDGESEKDAVEKIKSKLSDNLKDAGLNKTKYFVISNNNRSLWQFNDLVSYIERNLPGLKCDAVMLSILAELSVDDIDRRYKMLQDRLCKISVASVALATAPISGMDIVLNMSLICRELLLYHKAFGFEQQIVKDILKDDDIRQKLNANSIIEIQTTNEAMHTFAKIELEKLRTSEARLRVSPNDLISPFIEPGVWEWLARGDTFRLLIQVLDGCRDDAMLVYSHDDCLRAQRLRQRMAT